MDGTIEVVSHEFGDYPWCCDPNVGVWERDVRRYGGVDRQYQLFLHNLHWGFMHDGKYIEMRGDDVFPRDFLAVFGIAIGRKGSGGGGAREFSVNGVGSWLVGGKDCLGQFGAVEDDRVMAVFLSPLFYTEHPGDTVEAGRAQRRGRQRAGVVASMVEGGLISGGAITDADVMALVSGVSLDED